MKIKNQGVFPNIQHKSNELETIKRIIIDGKYQI